MNSWHDHDKSVLGRLAIGLAVALAFAAVVGSTGCDDLLQLSLGSPLTGSLDIGLSPWGIDLGLDAPFGTGSLDIQTGLGGTNVTCTGPDGGTG